MTVAKWETGALLFSNPVCVCGHTYIDHVRQPHPEQDGRIVHYSQGCQQCDCWTFYPEPER